MRMNTRTFDGRVSCATLMRKVYLVRAASLETTTVRTSGAVAVVLSVSESRGVRSRRRVGASRKWVMGRHERRPGSSPDRGVARLDLRRDGEHGEGTCKQEPPEPHDLSSPRHQSSDACREAPLSLLLRSARVNGTIEVRAETRSAGAGGRSEGSRAPIAA